MSALVPCDDRAATHDGTVAHRAGAKLASLASLVELGGADAGRDHAAKAHLVEVEVALDSRQEALAPSSRGATVKRPAGAAAGGRTTWGIAGTKRTTNPPRTSRSGQGTARRAASAATATGRSSTIAGASIATLPACTAHPSRLIPRAPLRSRLPCHGTPADRRTRPRYGVSHPEQHRPRYGERLHADGAPRADQGRLRAQRDGPPLATTDAAGTTVGFFCAHRRIEGGYGTDASHNPHHR